MSSPNSNNPVPNFFLASAADFKKIPGSPIAYWVSDKVRESFQHQKVFSEFFFSDGLTKTGNNDKYLRFHWEISRANASDSEKYRICVKGGEARDYYGNTDVLVNWTTEARNHYRKDFVARITPEYLWQSIGISWTKISSKGPTFRWFGDGMIAETGGPAIFSKESNDKYIFWQALGFLASKVSWNILTSLNPTLNFQTNDVLSLPFNSHETTPAASLTIKLNKISQEDWDAYETSWDFISMPLLKVESRDCEVENSNKQLSTSHALLSTRISEAYEKLRAHWHAMTLEMQRLEEENNRIFIDAYGLQDELTPDVPLSEITLTCNPHYRYGGSKTEEELETLLLTDTMKELISYSIGCMMGRYRLDEPGLIYAHSGNVDFEKIYHRTDAENAKKEINGTMCQEKEDARCKTENLPLRSLRLCGEFPPDDDGIIPIMDMPWFSDDAAGRFVEFMKVAWPPETLNENLQFVADALSPKRGEDPVVSIRRYLSTGFFKDHLKTYKKRPIYWLFSSGRQKAFECLVYLHRYNESTLSRMRSHYVTPLQGNIRSRIEFLENEKTAATSASAQRKIQKEIDMLKKKQTELSGFDDELRHYADMRISLDLDDGVKVNYGKFGNLLAEVKAITGE